MKRLNQIVWYLGYLISIIPVCIIVIYSFGADILVYIPLLIGIVGTLVLVAVGNGGDLNMAPPPVTDYPVPFIGLSKIGGSQVYYLAKNGFMMFVVPFGAVSAPILAVLIALITIPIGLVMFIMAACLIPYLAVVDALYLATLFLAKVIDRHQYSVNTSRFVCPECGKKSYRPVYDVEGRMIQGLCPTNKGIFSQEMEVRSVPCFGSKGGRKKLNQYCPDCKATVETEEGRSFVVSMAGAKSSGKTSFSFSVLGEFMSTNGNHKASSENFYFSRDDGLLDDYRRGICNPTPLSYNTPHILTFEAGRFVTKRHIFMCDVSGGFFSSDYSTDIQPQYEYNDAIVFTLDPTCYNAQDVAYAAYVGFMEKYRLYNKMDASKKITVPIAVVATRADKPGSFGNLVGAELREKMVEEGYFPLINMIEKDFLAVTFYSCDVSKEGTASEIMKHLSDVTAYKIGPLFKE